MEDDWLIATEHCEILQAVGYNVIGPVGSVKSALQMIEALQIDAAVLDLDLNGEPSYPVAERLVLESIPFLFVSGFSIHNLRKDFWNALLLPKPVPDTRLISAIRGLLRLA